MAPRSHSYWVNHAFDGKLPEMLRQWRAEGKSWENDIAHLFREVELEWCERRGIEPDPPTHYGVIARWAHDMWGIE